MKHTPRLTALGALLGLAIGGAAHAQSGVAYQVTNQTFAGGGTEFNVASDVTFERLYLNEVFSSGKTLHVDLFANPAQTDPNAPSSTLGTSVDTGVIELDSASFQNPDPSFGTLTMATLTGIFDNGLAGAPAYTDANGVTVTGATGFDANGSPFYLSGDTESLDIAPTDSIGGDTTPATVFAGFTTTLVNPTVGSTADIFAVDAGGSGSTYAAGTFSLFAPAAAPEPSPLAPLGLGVLGLGALGLIAARRRAVTP